VDAADEMPRDRAEGSDDQIKAQHEEEASKRYQDAKLHRERLIGDFLVALQLTWLADTRFSESQKWLMQNMSDELLESAVALLQLTEQGIFNVARRELRYMLEAAVKYIYVDRKLGASASLEDRVRFLGDTQKVPRSSVTRIDDLRILMVRDPDDFRAAVHSCFGRLSGYVHPSQPALGERLARAGRGEFSGFESARTLESFNSVASQCLDLVLVLLFNGIGPTSTGDLFTEAFDRREQWKFHCTRYVPQVSRFFDYKVERQGPSA